MSFVTDKCYQAKTGELEQEWFITSAEDKVLGRLASRLAVILMGKHKPTYTPHVDTGDFVIVTDVEKIKLTGRKLETMFHDYYTYYNSGRKVVPYKELMSRNPEKILMLAVRRMLPKNALAAKMLKKLKIYRGSEHPHQAQQPKPLD